MKYIAVIIVILTLLTGCGTANIGPNGPFETHPTEHPDPPHLPPGQG